ncbi:MAG: transcriptional repressor [Rhodobacteraceae bacterium]|nr:transcriptional repressor [Paracoccaceae bacterium]
MTALAFDRHNHDRCIAGALKRAETHCGARRLQFTATRRRVLEILLQEHRAMGAYDILAVLSSEGLGSQPPAAYRALDFLVREGLAHRIEGLNAYAACALPVHGPGHGPEHGQEDASDHGHVPAFLICRGCKAVAETETGLAQGRLGAAAREAGFSVERVVVEAEGLCPGCAGAGA